MRSIRALLEDELLFVPGSDMMDRMQVVFEVVGDVLVQSGRENEL